MGDVLYATFQDLRSGSEDNRRRKVENATFSDIWRVVRVRGTRATRQRLERKKPAA